MANDDNPGPFFKSDAYKVMREAAVLASEIPGTAGSDIVRRFIIVQAFERFVALLCEDGSAQAIGEVAGAIELVRGQCEARFGDFADADRKIASAAAEASMGALAGLLVKEGLAVAFEISRRDDAPSAEAN